MMSMLKFQSSHPTSESTKTCAPPIRNTNWWLTELQEFLHLDAVQCTQSKSRDRTQNCQDPSLHACLQKFFDRVEVRNILAYLQLTDNPTFYLFWMTALTCKSEGLFLMTTQKTLNLGLPLNDSLPIKSQPLDDHL
ncbi:hypothetical protein MJO28_010870 [Puccinia striiformis f. sp. tritici]|uniref:Uncharacterized protein n=3 Tax=Puccinia striiformis TaxID=27350 RepID=A0A2S4USW1_9BASI|nr:hypothetical protein MJO28_010870 [Puccinia striiformis f. sp. tritici]POW00318.1 hypothetical protein PSTT_13208 [Puccinia striiformis]POW19584.1 hypothetical protein PSHT_04497 [Puccinia striiformis]